ncbi:MAG: class I SAM-dependent methyltransferase [Acidobacteria bacterium]|nr:class I SAM-dependent methyltransferase [Acidobacteriota bacterium]
MAAPDSTAKDSLFGRPRQVIEAELPEREPVRCPLCDLDPAPFARDPQGFTLARCPGCHLEFLSPRPPFARLAERVYAHTYEDLSLAASQPTPEKKVQFERQLNLLERYLGRRGALLDVGCGAGAFLRLAAARGWQAAGTDIHLSEGARTSGARLWAGRLAAIDFGTERFDAVRFHHVLEHTENPLAELGRARALLRPNGLLYVSVPNLAGLSPRLKSWQSRWGMKRHPWRHYAALHHLWFFTPATLGRLVERAGFELLHWETPLRPKPGWPPWLTAAYRWLLEKPRRGSILDLYARAQ